MKRFFLFLFVIGLTAMSSTSMAAMSNSRVRQETRFLTDKMAHELNLNTSQYNDAYEINFDFIYSVRYLMDDVVRGYEWALDDYYQALDVRNDDLRWVLSSLQYRNFLRADYFYRPIYASGGRWNFRIYITYTNHNHFYFGKPYHYRSYCGGHYRAHGNSPSYYRGRYKHDSYNGAHSVRDDKVYRTNRRSDFGSVNIRPNTSTRPSSSTRPNTSTRPTPTTRPNSSNRPTDSSRPTTDSSKPNSGSSRPGSSSRPKSSDNSGSSSSRRDSKESSKKRESSSSSRSSSSESSSRSSERSNGSSRK